MGPDAMIFVFWMLSFKPTFSHSFFPFIKRLFSSSSLYAIRVVSSAYLRLLIFLPAILIPTCVSSSITNAYLDNLAWCLWALCLPSMRTIAICILHLYLVVQSCLTLCDSMHYSPPTSSVHGVLQAKILEWLAISCSRWSSQPRGLTLVSCIAGWFFRVGAIRKELLRSYMKLKMLIYTELAEFKISLWILYPYAVTMWTLEKPIHLLF